MTLQIALVLVILVTSVALLVTEWVAMEAVALLVLGCLALTGLVSPAEALAGFSNPAVVTVWAVFILSGGLTRTGIANHIGHWVLRLAGTRETVIVLVLMVSTGVMSAFMNNVAVAALMLPVAMDIARETGRSPSRLLMPLAYGSLLGGLTTLIGTPPNLLVSDALRDSGLTPFRLFDYTPVGLVVMTAGVAFVALLGRRLLPARDLTGESVRNHRLDLRDQYDLRSRMFVMRIPPGSELAGKTLAQSRLGSTLGLHVVEIFRNGRHQLAPGPSSVLLEGDRLLVQGRLEKMDELRGWRELVIDEDPAAVAALLGCPETFAEARIAADGPLNGRCLREIGFSRQYGVNVLAIRSDGRLRRSALKEVPLDPGQTLLLQGPAETLNNLAKSKEFSQVEAVTAAVLSATYRLAERLMLLQVPAGSHLEGKSLFDSRLSEALGLRVIFILRGEAEGVMPDPDEPLQAGDRLLAQGRLEDLRILRAIEDLQIERELTPERMDLESEHIGLMEAVLSPHTTLAGKTLQELNFREKYELSVLAVWHGGRAYRTGLRDMALQFGDALLLYGPREKLQLLGREPDFLVLTAEAQEIPRQEKARTALLIMAAALLPVLLGWAPISICAVVGAAAMIVTGCLSMEEAYRYIEWKAVFLIAGLLPLGTALEQSGAARLLAEGVVALVGPFGPLATLAGLVVITFAATCFIPTAALVVLMAPIVLSTSAGMGISPHALMMGVAMAASASFMTPISHPANLLVMGPGGYRFADYIKLGLPLTLLVLVVVLLVVPVFWPLAP